MGPIGLPELIVILVIVVIIFGANRLPQLGQGIGSAIKNFKNAVGDPTDPVSPPPTSTQLTCRNCSTVNPAGSRFCGNCGNKL